MNPPSQRPNIASAQWANPVQFAESFSYQPGDFWLGRSPVTETALGYNDKKHICLVAGTRGGKGTSVIIPNLCTWLGSVVVIDPKAENATVTAARPLPFCECR
jgi:type IV secretory pathway TraG/TraD family ATPase VirD4